MTRSLAGERIGVLGLARSGLAAARLALARGAQVYASDAGQDEAVEHAAAEIRALGGDAETGGHDLSKLVRCTRIVVSPGIPPDAAILRESRLQQHTIVPELEFAAQQIGAPLVVITGTNGKTTVTALVVHLLRTAGVQAEAGGNIGRALSEVALQADAPEVVVVEASSFQLGLTTKLQPAIGVVTNLSPDHLDRYPSVEAYYADKARLFANATPQSRWLLNGDDAAVLALAGDAPGERCHFRIESPLSPSERGGYVDAEGWLVLRTELGATEERLLPAADLTLLGQHNRANCLCAALAARLAGASVPGIAEGLRSFAGLEHRLEPVAEVEGVLWINDSKATNIASTTVAVRSMERPTILLLGGRHKGEPYSDLLPVLENSRVREVIAYGEAGERIERDLSEALPVTRVGGDLEAVVRTAAGRAKGGDAVLLSPACASYDMFRDFEERGDRFRQLVLEAVP